MKCKFFTLRWLSIVAGVFLLTTMCDAQITTATVTGSITDPTGAVIPSADISMRNLNTGVVTKSVTNGEGLYRISGIQPGVYRETVSKTGFKQVVKDTIQLNSEDVVQLNFVLQIGSVSESVTVQAGEPLLNTQTTSLGETIAGLQVENAPLNGRNAMNLVSLVPGVIPQGSSQGAATATQGGNYNPAGLGNYQIGGSIAGWNATFIDGANVNASGQNWQSLIPTQDSVAEFRVDSNAVTPQYGRFAGGVINFTTRSGTNQFHGTAYEYVRNTIFDANSFFNDRLGAPVPHLHQNQFGATLGGPIVRNKSFFFFSWESLRINTEGASRYRAVTPAEMSGDFRADGPTYDIKTGARADCGGVLDTFCASEIDPTALAMYNAKPSYFAPVESDPARLALLEAGGYNGEVFPKNNNNSVQYVTRIDHQLSSKQRLFARYTYWNVDLPVASELANPAVPLGPTKSTTNQVVLGDNYTFSPTLNVDVHLAYTRFLFDVGTAGNGNYDLSQFGPNWAAIGSQLAFKAPPTFFPSLSWFGQAGGLDLQQHNHNDNYSLSGNFTKVAGRHSLQFGGEFRRVEYYSGTSIYPSGNFATPGIGTFNGAVNRGIGNFVEGVTVFIPGFSTIDIASAPSAYEYYQGYYVTDAYQVKPNLLLNLGVRWELPGAWFERHDHNSVLLPNKANPLGSFANPVPGGPTTLMGELAAVNSPDYHSRAQTVQHLHLFEPRLGLTYSLDSNTVLRFGFGISAPCLDCGSSATEVGGSPFNSAATLNPTNASGFGSLSNPYPNGINQPLGRSTQVMEPYSQFPQTLIGGNVSSQIPYGNFPYVMQWNANLQQSLGRNTSFMVSYSGNRGVHLGSYNINLNQLPDQYDSLGATLLTPVVNPFFGVASPSGSIGGKTASYGRFLMPYPQFTQFVANGLYYGEDSYHDLTTTWRTRFSSASTLNLNYSWAHLISNLDSQNGYLEPGESQIGFGPQDYTNPKADRSNSADDVRQRFVAEYILALPVGKGKRLLGNANGLVDHIVAGWNLDGITTIQTGLPIGMVTSSGNVLSSQFGAGTIRPNVVPNVSKRISGSRFERTLPGHTWFNTAAFQAPPTNSFVFGNESRLDSTLRNDGIFNWDMGLSKTTAISERFSIQLRAEYFNVFNRPQFAFDGADSNTNLQAGGPTFGQISTTANQARIGQFSVRFTY